MKNNELWASQLAAGAQELGIVLSPEQIDSMLLYMTELSDWNQRINLTSITNEHDVITKHFLDSLSVLRAIPDQAVSVLDVGSGGGFPGIPIQIARPDLHVILMDSIKKKTDFLIHLKTILNLQFSVLNVRAEDGARMDEMRESFDIVVSRAVAALPILSEFCLPYVRPGGRFIAMKSLDVQDELAKAEKAIKVLGGGNVAIIKVEIPQSELERNLIIVEKLSHTPEAYPRRPGVPEKRPLIDS